MVRYHLQDGIKVPFSEAEELARDIEEQAWADNAPMRLWRTNISKTDETMTRSAEDIWDVVGVDTAPQYIQEAHAAKKVVRGEKP
jgi:hypothetical protein